MRLQVYWQDGSIKDRLPDRKSVVALGFFDGVHLGHQAILRRAKLLAQEIGGISVAVTFDRHPLAVVGSGPPPLLLTSRQQRWKYILETGVEAVVELPFDKQFSQLSPESFIDEILVDRLGAVAVVVGYNFHFGRQGRGDVRLLQKRGRMYGLQVQEIAPVLWEKEVVSSTRIRQLLKEGRVEEAARLLGRFYRLAGEVVPGEGRGQKLGFPTANLGVKPERLIPADGVYAVGVWHISSRGGEVKQMNGVSVKEAASQPWAGVLAISDKPTFGGGMRTVEVHIIEQRQSYYGEQLEVAFWEWLRPIRCFKNGKELARQLRADIAAARKACEKRIGSPCTGRDDLQRGRFVI